MSRESVFLSLFGVSPLTVFTVPFHFVVLVYHMHILQVVLGFCDTDVVSLNGLPVWFTVCPLDPNLPVPPNPVHYKLHGKHQKSVEQMLHRSVKKNFFLEATPLTPEIWPPLTCIQATMSSLLGWPHFRARRPQDIFQSRSAIVAIYFKIMQRFIPGFSLRALYFWVRTL